jgi:hypothetical protein
MACEIFVGMFPTDPSHPLKHSAHLHDALPVATHFNLNSVGIFGFRFPLKLASLTHSFRGLTMTGTKSDPLPFSHDHRL